MKKGVPNFLRPKERPTTLFFLPRRMLYNAYFASILSDATTKSFVSPHNLYINNVVTTLEFKNWIIKNYNYLYKVINIEIIFVSQNSSSILHTM